MTRISSVVFIFVIWAASAGAAVAIERFPPPDFTDHELPTTQVVPPRADAWQIADAWFLVTGLGLAGYFALVRRSRAGLLTLTVASLVWLGFFREGCVCPIGAIQNVARGLADPTYPVPYGVIAFFTLPLVAAIFFGRAFCAAVCPLGAVQELVVLRPVRVPRWLEHALGLIPYIYLGAGVALAATGTVFVICRYDPFVGFFRFGAPVGMLVFGGLVLVLGMFVGRPYCRYLCPYGAILGVLAKLARWRVRITPDECIQCRLCEDACPYGAIEPPTVAPRAATRPVARRRLVYALVALPVLVAAGGWLGRQLDVPLARLDFTVRLAQRIRAEEQGLIAPVTDPDAQVETEETRAVDAFRSSGRTDGDLYAEADMQVARLGTAGMLLGAWTGLVIGAKLVHLSIRRRRTDYTAEPSRCVACGRCYRYCPREQVRLGLLQEEGFATAAAPGDIQGDRRP
ncbi:MAG: 4Fe-4S binding protein [Pirellulales bacterium]|nr:4Fe-4S binding protein [Pirellulales bacterium]